MIIVHTGDRGESLSQTDEAQRSSLDPVHKIHLVVVDCAVMVMVMVKVKVMVGELHRHFRIRVGVRNDGEEDGVLVRRVSPVPFHHKTRS